MIPVRYLKGTDQVAQHIFVLKVMQVICGKWNVCKCGYFIFSNALLLLLVSEVFLQINYESKEPPVSVVRPKPSKNWQRTGSFRHGYLTDSKIF